VARAFACVQGWAEALARGEPEALAGGVPVQMRACAAGRRELGAAVVAGRDKRAARQHGGMEAYATGYRECETATATERGGLGARVRCAGARGGVGGGRTGVKIGGVIGEIMTKSVHKRNRLNNIGTWNDVSYGGR